MTVEQLLEIRRPFDRLEQEVVRRHLARSEETGQALLDALRYVISFARLTLIRTTEGRDVDVAPFLAPHAWKVLSTLTPHLEDEGDDTLWGAVRELPGLVSATRNMRAQLLKAFPMARDRLEDEVCYRNFVVVAGGGGGSGYGYAGAFTLLDRVGLQPALIVGTSMGSLIGLFRARRRRFDMAAMFEGGRCLSWNGVFKALQSGSRYGVPATLRLHLHEALAHLFRRSDGQVLTVRDLEIPMRIITTGLTLEALKHDMDFYEHYFEDSVNEMTMLAPSGLKRMASLVSIFKELMTDEGAVQRIVFGEDPLTLDADVLDAAGFSSAIPGLIHYDVMRDDSRMKDLLDQLYAARGIVRMGEGGIVDNVPSRVAYECVMAGELVRRNLFVLALDCFAPQPRFPFYYPLQQMVHTNVVRGLPYTHLYMPLVRVLNALNLVPPIRSIEVAMRWTMEELKPHIPSILSLCSPIPVLSDG